MESGFSKKLIVFWSAESGGKNPYVSNTSTSRSMKGSKASPVGFEKLAKILRTRFSTSHAPDYKQVNEMSL